MIIYKNQGYFVTPKRFNTGDMEFNVFNSNGVLIGTNFEGLQSLDLIESERYELEDIIQVHTMELEIELKFMKEYGVRLTDWKDLLTSKEEILKNMNEKWNIIIALI